MSVSSLFRKAWIDLWHNPGIYNLVFWNLIVTLLLDLAFESRVAPLLPAVFSHGALLIGGLPKWPVLPASSWLKIGLFFASAVLIVTPFRVAGLYGGVFELMARRPGLSPLFFFFTAGRRLFWRGLGATLAGVVLLAALFLALWILSLPAAALGGAGVLFLVLWLVLVVWAIGLVLMGLGAIMANDRPGWEAVLAALRWAVKGWWTSLRIGFMIVGLLLLVLLLAVLLKSVPVLGSIFVLVVLWVATGYTAVLPALLYRTEFPTSLS